MPIRTGEEYIESLRGRNLKIYLFGELVKNYVDHKMIRPSINAVAETYDLAVREEELATAHSSITGQRVNRSTGDERTLILNPPCQESHLEVRSIACPHCLGSSNRL